MSFFILNILSTAGQERFRTITSSYYRGAHGVMIIYDVSRKETFNNLNKWLSEVECYAQEGVLMLLVGNKTDLETTREVSSECGEEWATTNDMPFIETSAKNAKNVDEAFRKLAEMLDKHVTKVDQKNRAFMIGANQVPSSEPQVDKCSCS